MKVKARIISCLTAVCLFTVVCPAQKVPANGEVSLRKSYKAPQLEKSAPLQSVLENAVSQAIEAFRARGFKNDEVAASLIDLSDPEHLRMAEVRGSQRIYPASVVKLFYLPAIESQIESGAVKQTPELTRGIRDMIVDSSNEATQYILDVITGTSSGAELPDKEFQDWQYKRNKVNRFYTSMGYLNINVNQKTFCEDAYGIEQQSRNYKGENRNMLTTDATARLMAEIVLGRTVSAEGTQRMLDLLKRNPFAGASDQDDQAHAFTGKMLIERGLTDAKLWSKAGWTSKARHDAAYIETANGLKFVLVVFTENHAAEKDFIPAVAGRVLDGLKK